jgi:hypothetical protein
MNRLPDGTLGRKIRTKRYNKQVPGHQIPNGCQVPDIHRQSGRKGPALSRPRHRWCDPQVHTEIGTLERKQVGSLAGLAPHNRESGMWRWLWRQDRSTPAGRISGTPSRDRAARVRVSPGPWPLTGVAWERTTGAERAGCRPPDGRCGEAVTGAQQVKICTPWRGANGRRAPARSA